VKIILGKVGIEEQKEILFCQINTRYRNRNGMK